MDLKNPPSISHSIYYLSKAIVAKKMENQKNPLFFFFCSLFLMTSSSPMIPADAR
jgi:hypothetical protein